MERRERKPLWKPGLTLKKANKIQIIKLNKIKVKTFRIKQKICIFFNEIFLTAKQIDCQFFSNEFHHIIFNHTRLILDRTSSGGMFHDVFGCNICDGSRVILISIPKHEKKNAKFTLLVIKLVAIASRIHIPIQMLDMVITNDPDMFNLSK